MKNALLGIANQANGHGLVMSLRNATSGSGAIWSTEAVLNFSEHLVRNVNDLKRTTNVSGYTNTKALTKDDETANKYPAANITRYISNAGLGSTGWFLPSAQQWVKMQEGLGGLNESVIKWVENFDTSCTAVNKWEAALAKAGTGNYDSMTYDYGSYRTSSEYSIDACVYLEIEPKTLYDFPGFRWDSNNKGSYTMASRVRLVLAF